MNKKTMRNAIAKTILLIEAGKARHKTTKEVLVLKSLPQDLLDDINNKMATSNISRRSIYCTIEMLAFTLFTRETLTDHLQHIHEFCYTQLAK